MTDTDLFLPTVTPDAVENYIKELVEHLRTSLGRDLVAVLVGGSVAFDDWIEGPSDIDVYAVVAGPLSRLQKEALAVALDHKNFPCPARGLELVVYSRPEARTPRMRPRFELNLNTGMGIPELVSYDNATDPPHWFVIDREMTRARGKSIVGPRPTELFLPAPDEWVFSAIIESLDWHALNESNLANSILNACRAWRYLEERMWSSKTSAGLWAAPKSAHQLLITAAVSNRSSHSNAELDRSETVEFLKSVRRLIGESAQA
jgi:hypothetical protein